MSVRDNRTSGSGRAPRRILGTVGLLLGMSACQLLGTGAPTPEQILAAIDNPSAPVLNPADAAASFRLARGFRIELVAAEPLVEDPVAIDWDDEGRLFAVEMRGYMPNVEGEAEDVPNGRIVVLEDRDGDGRMDERHIYLDGLVLPRAVAVLPEGVLVGEPPNLWLCRDTTPEDPTPHCDEKMRVSDYGVGGMNPEHNENALLRGVNGRIYNARSQRRFFLERESPTLTTLRADPARVRGQGGLAPGEDGTFFYNSNSTVLLGDRFDAEGLLRHPVTAASWQREGIGEMLLPNATIHSIRVNPGLNRAYSPGELRPDGRLQVPTAVSGLALYRGDQFGPEFANELGSTSRRHIFVPEPGANVVLHVELGPGSDGAAPSAEIRRYADPNWGERDFVASLDERFRPVNANVGPDGALYLVDMYRGVIQHKSYVSEYLAEYIARQGLSEPLGLGRIWRVVRERSSGGGKLRRSIDFDASRASTGERLAALSHPNFWQRGRAQQWLVHDWNGQTGEGLRRTVQQAPSVSARARALWALEQRSELDLATWLVALRDEEASIRTTALRAGAAHLQKRPRTAEIDALAAALADPDAAVALQAVLSANASEARAAELLRAHVFPRWDNVLLRQAYLSGQSGEEAASIEALAAQFNEASGLPDSDALIRLARIGSDLTNAWFTRLNTEDPDAIAGLLDSIAAYGMKSDTFAAAMLGGISDAALTPGFKAAQLAEPHPLLANAALQPGQPLAAERTRARRAVTWPGDNFVPGLPVLNPEQVAQVEEGGALFAETCAVCHGDTGAGLTGIAPTLAGTAYVNDADDWLIRIVLHGLRGPVDVRGQHFDAVMPGHVSDSRFNDTQLGNLLSFIRRSWGNDGRWIDPSSVGRVRAETADRIAPWTVEELLELDVDHQLDRFVGSYKLSNFPMSFKIARNGVGLELVIFGMGSNALERQGGMKFAANADGRGLMGIEFIEDSTGQVSSFLLQFGGGQSVTASRLD
ncbi:MAG: c-type cytochrome [Myxococcota bacterium]|nr:c-type cytochrome [Myxococcota bacterium]